MAVSQSAQVESQTHVHREDEYTPLREAMRAAAAKVLEGYDDRALLAQRRASLITKVKPVVRAELQASAAELLIRVSPRRAALLLQECLTNEARKRQFRAFERHLAAQYGPLDPQASDLSEYYAAEVNGIAIFTVRSSDLEAAGASEA